MRLLLEEFPRVLASLGVVGVLHAQNIFPSCPLPPGQRLATATVADIALHNDAKLVFQANVNANLLEVS